MCCGPFVPGTDTVYLLYNKFENFLIIVAKKIVTVIRYLFWLTD
jgi:hypothetical protein